MDPELIAYLDQRFHSIDQRFHSIDQRFDSIDQRFQETSQQISALREETLQRFEQVDRRFEQVDEANRHTRVLVEELRDKIELVAEGQVGLSERIENLEKQAAQTFDTVKGLIAPFYRELDGRIRALEDSDRGPAEGQPRRRPQAAG